MVVYIITKKVDHSSQIIYKWLIFFGIRAELINSILDLPNKIEIENESVLIYNRSIFQFEHEIFQNADLTLSVHEEERAIKLFINYILTHNAKVCFFNKSNSYSNNKLIQYEIAKKIGLKVPFTKIITKKEEIFIYKKDIITKPVAKGITSISKKTGYINYTSEVTKLKLPENLIEYFPSLIQEKIIKQFDIRTFYLEGKCYSMAILSQTNSKTKIDFRNYDKANPNRCLPYKLPKKIEVLIHKLMIFLRLECGAIDIIKDINNEYYFLEVNPNGEYGFMSTVCNYNFELLIAEKLKSIVTNEKNKQAFRP